MHERSRLHPTAIERFADWVMARAASEFSPREFEQAKIVLLDTIGCGIAGLEDACARAVIAALIDNQEATRCTVLGHARGMSAPSAVLANGTLVRVLDLNDYVIGADPISGSRGGHPSDNIPTALAAAELGEATGRELLAAILLGYEIYGRGKSLMSPSSPWDGVSISALVGPAIAGRLMRLSRDALANAIGLSLARAATPVAVREGGISAAKSVANALIAQSGMQACLLARRGLTGPLDLFEAERGIAPVFAHAAKAADVLGAPLPAQRFMTRVGIKAYPCFAGAQSAVAAAIGLHQRVGGQINRLTDIEVTLADLPVVRRQLTDPGRIAPQSREAADHSLQFLVAVALLDGTFGLAQFEGDRWTDPAVTTLMARLRIIFDPELVRHSQQGYPCVIQAIAEEGQAYQVAMLAPPTLIANGFDQNAVMEKFNRVTNSLNGESRARIISEVMALDAARSCHSLMQALTAPAY